MERADVIILGGGMIGLTLALALDRHRLSSIVIDPLPPEAGKAPGFDGRATAVSSSSWKMLEAIGIGERIAAEGCPINSIRVSDGLEPGGLVFDAGPEEGPLGIMFENRLLRTTLREAADAAEHITMMTPAEPGDVVRDSSSARVALKDGRLVEAPLVVAAEGRNSPMREAAGIRMARWSYDHVAIVATVTHEVPHDNIAYEIFYPAGPFAILPMLPGTRSAIVWSVRTKDAPAILDLPDRAFTAELAKRMGGFLGALELAAPRSSYKLGFHHAAKITGQRLVLAGDSAHGIHPIAGQGLNLGFRDVAALAQVLVEGARIGLDLGDAQLLARYERWRSLDSLMVAAATDGLTRLYGIPSHTASAIRRLGMGIVQRVGPLKSWLMSEARGENGDLPLLLRGLTI